MSYEEIPPPAELAPWVTSWWLFRVAPEAPAIEHRIPVTGGAMVSIGCDGELLLAGPRVDPLVTTVRGGEWYRGIHFRPGAASSILGVPAPQLRDALLPARYLIDPRFVEALATAADGADFSGWASILLARSRDAAVLDRIVQLAVALIVHTRGAVPIAAIANETNCTPRHLRRLFQEHVALTPKELARVVRLRAAAAAAATSGDPWVDLAADGFADQPHLAREFRSILGVTPGEFSRHARRIAHRLI